MLLYKCMVKDIRIDEYISKLSKWQIETCKKLRKIIHDSIPEIDETIKRSNRPYFTYKGNVCALQATKDHINLFIYDPIADDPENIINQGKDNLTARSIQIYQDTDINESALKCLLISVADNNRLGGWRNVMKSSKPTH